MQQGPGGDKPVRRGWDWTQVPLMLTALAAVGALYFNTNQTSKALQATRDQVGLSEQGQLTDRFSKAVEQLGTKDSLEVRPWCRAASGCRSWLGLPVDAVGSRNVITNPIG